MTKLDLTAQLAAQMVGRHFGPQAPEAYDKPMNIVVAGNGVFRVAKTPVATFTTKVADIPVASKLPGLANMQEGPELIIPKIPLKYLIQILTFYRDVHDKDKTEASTLFFWNHDEAPLPTLYSDKTVVKGLTEDGQLVIYCPQQKNSGTLSEFHEDGMVNYLREHCTPLCEIHSHHTMDAFWSGTDNANENMTQFYGVWGKIKDEEPKFLFRWVSGDSKINIDASLLFDIPQIEIKTTVTRTVPVEGFEPVVSEVIKHETFKGPWQRVEYPEDWMGQHRKTFGATAYKGGTYGYGGGYGGAKTYGTPGVTKYPGGAYGDHHDPYAYGTAYGQGGLTNQELIEQYGNTDENGDIIVHATEGKKNLGNVVGLSEEGKTEVEVFLDKSLSTEKSLVEVEELVKHLVEELIDLGYDSVIADTVAESTDSVADFYSGNGYYY